MRSLKKAVIIGISAIILFLVYRILFVKTVYYEIGSIKIPSKYNALTGKVTPLMDYSGKPLKKTIKDEKIKGAGLSSDQTSLAKLRWAIFEQWVKNHPEFKGWDSNPELFKKANSEFRREMEAGGFKIKIIK